MRSTFHHGKVKKSKRLQRVLATLKFYGTEGLTTFELGKYAISTRPASDASELRAQGIAIDCKYEGLSQNGEKIYRYKLV